MSPDTAHVKEVVRRHWAARAAGFDAGPTHGLLSDAQRAAWANRLRRWAGTTPLDVLDVGCGTGFLALQLAALGHRARGIDVAEEMLAIARDKAVQAGLALTFERADAEVLPYDDRSFDLLVERHVIWTLPQPADALAEWSRVLRRRGRLILIEGNCARVPLVTTTTPRLPRRCRCTAASQRRTWARFSARPASPTS